jgi:hypothetical protein
MKARKPKASTETDARFLRRMLLHVPWSDRPRLKRLVQKILDAKEHNGRKRITK